MYLLRCKLGWRGWGPAEHLKCLLPPSNWLSGRFEEGLRSTGVVPVAGRRLIFLELACGMGNQPVLSAGKS